MPADHIPYAQAMREAVAEFQQYEADRTSMALVDRKRGRQRFDGERAEAIKAPPRPRADPTPRDIAFTCRCGVAAVVHYPGRGPLPQKCNDCVDRVTRYRRAQSADRRAQEARAA